VCYSVSVLPLYPETLSTSFAFRPRVHPITPGALSDLDCMIAASTSPSVNLRSLILRGTFLPAYWLRRHRKERVEKKVSLFSLFRHLLVSDLQHGYAVTCAAGLCVCVGLPYVFAVVEKLDPVLPFALINFYPCIDVRSA
jgi:hypothetical protein